MANTKNLGKNKILTRNDLRQSPAYGQFMTSLGWRTIDIPKLGQGFLRNIPLIPLTILKVQRFVDLNGLDKLQSIIKRNRVILTKLEPGLRPSQKLTSRLKKYSFKFDNWPLSPSKTLIIDLNKTNKQLLENMKSKTRYNIRLAEKKKIEINIYSGKKTSNSVLKKFYQIWQKRRRQIKLPTPKFKEFVFLRNAFENNFSLLTAEKSNLLAGLIILKYQTNAWYWHNGATQDGFSQFAPTLLTWEAIKLAKKIGCTKFDFEGVYDQRFHRQTKSWQGFSRFKKGFGGAPVEFAGTFSRWSNLLAWL